jgi:phosphatidyl-myo-inositol alpha-mannosyltransferase
MAAPTTAHSDERPRLAEQGERRRALRRQLGTTVTALLLAALVVLALAKINLADVGQAIAAVNGWWVAAAVLLMAAAFLARSESWHTAIREALPDERIGRAVVTRALLIGMAGSSVAPGRLGEAARAWLIARRAGRLRDALATVVGTLLSQTLLNLLALVILSVIALAGSAIPGARTESIILTALVPAICVVVLVGGPALLARSRALRPGRLGRVGWVGRVGSISDWIHAQLVDVRQGLVVFRRPGPAVHSTAFQLLAWAFQWGACYAVLLAFGLQQRAGIAAAAAVLVAVNITAILPVTPSSVGVFQAACIAVLAPFGIHAGEGLAYGLVLQAVEIGCALAMGLPALLVEGVSIAELRAHAGTSRRAPDPGRPMAAGERGAGNRV